MLINSSSILELKGSDRLTRLSYVFADDDGRTIGLTSRWIWSPDGKLLRSSPCITERPEVFVGGRVVGNLNPDYDKCVFGDERPANLDPQLFRAGAVTCSLTIRPEVKIGDEFEFAPEVKIEPITSVVGSDVNILGGGVVGTIQEGVEHLRFMGKIIYPLLRLQRSPADLLKGSGGIRIGAMVTALNNALIGVIVGASEDHRLYSVAPITDVLEWHHLQFRKRPEKKVNPGQENDRVMLDLPPLGPGPSQARLEKELATVREADPPMRGVPARKMRTLVGA